MTSESENEQLRALFANFVKDPDQLLTPLGDPVKIQERILLLVMPKGTCTSLSRSLFEYVGGNVAWPWVMESMIPIPMLSCLVDENTAQAINAAYTTFGKGAKSRIFAASGNVEFGIQDFGGRKRFGSFGEIIGMLLAAAFALAPDRSWVDEFVQSTYNLKQTGHQVFCGRLFYSLI